MELESIKSKIKKTGLKKSHIAKQIGCSPVELSHFLANRRNLRPDVFTRLLNYIK